MQAKDQLRNKRLCGGDVFAVRLNGPDNIEGLVLDNDDGTYTVNYTATVAGKYELAITDGALQQHLLTTPGTQVSLGLFSKPLMFEWAQKRVKRPQNITCIDYTVRKKSNSCNSDFRLAH